MSSSPFDDVYAHALNALRMRKREGFSGIENEELVQWSREAECSVSDFLDKFAIEISADFYVGFLSWEFADGVANTLRHALLEFSASGEEFPWPDKFWEFYLAFDESEFRGPQEPKLIRNFLSKHGHAF